MKAHRLQVRRVDIPNQTDSFDFESLFEIIILATPPEGSSTKQILQANRVYMDFCSARSRVTKSEWTWWLSPELFEILKQQLSYMRWTATNNPHLRFAVIEFITQIENSIPEEMEVPSS